MPLTLYLDEKVKHVLALLDTGAEVTILNGNPSKLSGPRVLVNGYGGAETVAKAFNVKMSIGEGLPFTANVLIADIPEYILGMDVLLGKSVTTDLGEFVFGNRKIHVRVVNPVVVGHAKWSPLHLPPPADPVCVKQYRLPGGHKEIGETIESLVKAGIMRPAVSPFNSPIWPVRRPDGAWRLTIDYRILNKKVPPLAAAVPDIITLIENLTREVGEWHVVLDLANAFFSIDIDTESQDQFAITWGDRQFTFTKLPQGYVHSPTLCHGLIARDLKMVQLDNVFIAHYIDDIMLTSVEKEHVENAAEKLITHMQNRGWAINPKKVQGPAQEVKFLGAIWSGSVKKIPDPVIDMVQQMAPPADKKEAQRFIGLMGFWRNHIPHLSLILKPIYKVTRKKHDFTWGLEQQTSFQQAKDALQNYITLGPLTKTDPFELEILVYNDVAVWSLWQKQGHKRVPQGFWSRKLTDPMTRYTPLEKQVAAVYWALVETERITGEQPVTICTEIPIMGWVRDTAANGKSGRAQDATHVKWKWYLQQRAKAGRTGVSRLQEQMLEAVDLEAMPEPNTPVALPESPFKVAPAYDTLTEEEQKSAWFTDGTAKYDKGQRHWQAVAFQPHRETLLMREGVGGSSQYAELQAVASVIEQVKETETAYIYTDSWATYQGLTHWAPAWRRDGWQIKNTPIWGGPDIWEEMWCKGERCKICIGHVDAHMPPDTSLAALFNNEVDQMAKIRPVTTPQEAEVLQGMADWAHQTSGHLGQTGTYQWAKKRQLPITMDQARQAASQCSVCSEVKHYPLERKPQGPLRRGERAASVWQVDYIGPLPPENGKHYVLTMVDTYSGLLLAYPAAHADQRATLQGMEYLIRHYGIPDEIQSDQGSHFAGHNVQDWALEQGIKWTLHISRYPESSALVERSNGLLKQQIKKLTKTHTLKGWSKHLAHALFELNNRPLGNRQTPFVRLTSEKVESTKTLVVWKTDKEAKLPVQATAGSIGLDLSTCEDDVIPAGQTKSISLGIGIKLPAGTYGRIAARSSLAKQGIDILGGVIDPDYRGTVSVLLHNAGASAVPLTKYDRIAQLICEQAVVPLVVESKQSPDTTLRGEGGFGSTGKKVWVHHPNKKPEAGEVLSQGVGSTYVVLLHNSDVPVYIPATRLTPRT